MPDGAAFHRSGNFAPIAEEHDLPELPVRGELPRGLRGTLFRNGPNPQFHDPLSPGAHWFLGDGMVHAFVLSEGRARYRNRWVRTHKWQAERAAGRPLLPEYPKPTPRGLAIPNTGVANTNIVFHAGKLLALEEGHLPFELDPATLETRGLEQFRGILRGPFTAHPKVDPATGDMLFFGYGADGPLTAGMTWGEIWPDGRVGRLERFQAPYPAMVHDFAITERHVMFPVMPLVGSRWRAITKGQPFVWDPSFGGYVGLMRRDRGTRSLCWFRTESCYVFHVVNAWDEGERVVADVMQYAAPPLFPCVKGPRPAAEATRARLVRWTLDPKARTDWFRTEVLDDSHTEFPRLDERRTGRPNRHAAYCVNRNGGEMFDAVAWRDLRAGRAETFALPPGDAVSEAVFVPRRPEAEEGDGWLLAVAWRAREGRSDLLVLDTGAVAAGPVATVALPHRVPFGFHGNWVPAAAAAAAVA